MKQVDPMVVAGPNKLITEARSGSETAVADVFWVFVSVIFFLMTLSNGISFQNQIFWPLAYIV